MSVKLSTRDEQLLNGQLADVQGAAEMMNVSQAHIDGCGLLSETGLEFAETLAAKGGKVSIPTTLNMGPLDLQNWKRFGVDEDFAAKAIRQAIWDVFPPGHVHLIKVT
ncbi:MAG: aconitase X [Planctomycetota bacterium]|jgi:predicted aconitase